MSAVLYFWVRHATVVSALHWESAQRHLENGIAKLWSHLRGKTVCTLKQIGFPQKFCFLSVGGGGGGWEPYFPWEMPGQLREHEM